MALRLNPLSVAKGKKFLCEMCGKPATLSCQHCRVTYYCAREHQSVDWFGIHEKICQLLGALRTLRPTLGSEDERQRRNLTVQMSQHALIDLCKNEAQKHLVQGQYELAIPGALQSLRFSMEVYGAGRIELVPAYLLLAESNLGLRRYKVAEEFLLYANWSVLKNPDCSNELKSQLYRNFGKLYASQGRFQDALKQLAHDVYYSSLESGPEHIDTAGGYFYMADVFLTQGVVEHALALYDKVVDIWYKFLINLRHRPDESITDYLSEAHIGEAVEMLRSILETRQKYLGSQHIATGEAAYALGILKHITGFDAEARECYQQALRIYEKQLGSDNESTAAILRAIEDLPADGDEKQNPPLGSRPFTGDQQGQIAQHAHTHDHHHDHHHGEAMPQIESKEAYQEEKMRREAAEDLAAQESLRNAQVDMTVPTLGELVMGGQHNNNDDNNKNGAAATSASGPTDTSAADDGSFSETEIKAVFLAMDTSGDGKVSWAELKAGVDAKQVEWDLPEGFAEAFWQTANTDDDAYLTWEETWAIFKEFKRDTQQAEAKTQSHEQARTQDEASTGEQKKGEQAPETVTEAGATTAAPTPIDTSTDAAGADKNGPGTDAKASSSSSSSSSSSGSGFSHAEVKALFDSMDTSGDGKVQWAELKVGLQQKQEAWGLPDSFADDFWEAANTNQDDFLSWNETWSIFQESNQLQNGDGVDTVDNEKNNDSTNDEAASAVTEEVAAFENGTNDNNDNNDDNNGHGNSVDTEK